MLTFLLLARCTNACKVGNDLFGIFSFASSRFSGDENRLILADIHHTLVRSLGYTKDVGWAFGSSFTDVDLHCTLSVDWESFVWVDSDTKQSRVGVDQLILVPDDRVPQNTSIVQVRQICHVNAAIKLGRVDLPNLIFLENFFSLFRKILTVILSPSVFS